jgi:hypothetical protein
MKSKVNINSQTPARNDRLKVRLDSRTTIILHGMSVLKEWKKRFPDAQIIR